MAKTVPAMAVFHSPCAFGPDGTTREACLRMTSVAARNLNGCVRTACTCPLRICRACVTQGKSEPVTDFASGMCAFHAAYGADKVPSKKPERPLPGDEAYNPLPTVARRAEAVNGNDPLVRLEPCTASPGPYALGVRSDQGRLPPAKKLEREPRLIPKRTRASVQRAIVVITDPTTGLSERVGAYEAIEWLQKLYAVDKNWAQAGRTLDLNPNVVANLCRIMTLPESLRKKLSSSIPPRERISVNFAYDLAQMSPERREHAVAAYFAEEGK